MVELTIEMESPYTIIGETTKKLKRGEEGTWNFTVRGDPTAPDMEAEIYTFVPGPVNPMTDFASGYPKWILDGVEVDARTHRFMFPSGGTMLLDVLIKLSKTAPWREKVVVQADVRPYYRP